MLRGSLPAVAGPRWSAALTRCRSSGCLSVGHSSPCSPRARRPSRTPSARSRPTRGAATATAPADGSRDGEGGDGRATVTTIGPWIRRRCGGGVEADGIRIQAHIGGPRAGDRNAGGDGAHAGGHDGSAGGVGNSVRLFTRTLDDITARLPEVVAALAGLPVRTAVFDGELIALRPDGRPYAFQDTAARPARRAGGDEGPRRATAIRGAAFGLSLRRAAPGRGRPDRPARRGAARGAGRRRPGRDADAASGDRRRGGGGSVLPRRGRAGA